MTRETDCADAGAFPQGRPSIAAVFARFLRYGFYAFGGPVVQISMLRHELVERERWTQNATFTRALAVYQALPGPEATEMCCWFGHIARGRLGAVAAGVGYVLPGFLLMLLCAWLYVEHGVQSPWVAAAFAGMQPAALALLMKAVPNSFGHVLKMQGAVVACAFALAADFAGVPFWVPLLGGAMWCGLLSRGLAVRAAACGAFFAVLWWSVQRGESAPIVLDAPQSASAPVVADAWALFETGLKAGLLTFGGAYTAIPFVRGDVVTKHGWIGDAQFLDGIAICGVLPAPLVIFTTFVGYVVAGLSGACAITLGMFLPAFSFTLVGHAWIDRLVHEPRFHAALDGTAAAALGLIAATALRLCHARLDSWFAWVLFACALVILLRVRKISTVPLVIVTAAVAGLLFY